MAIKLSLGPVPYCWPREAVHAFYRRVAKWPVDIVYLGETVCARRGALSIAEWLALAGKLEASGKEVVLSTLLLPETASDLLFLQRLCGNGHHPVEANDMAAVHLLPEAARFVAGSGSNIYNDHTLRFLAGLGMYRWVAPVELTRDALADIQRHRPPGVETEVLFFGRMPLAVSTRCFTARSHGLPRDACGDRCRDDPDGLSLATREGEPFLTVNGTQLLSALPYNLFSEIHDLAALGVNVLRIIPETNGTEALIDLLHRFRTGTRSLPETIRHVQALFPNGTCNGYWHGGAGMASTDTTSV